MQLSTHNLLRIIVLPVLAVGCGATLAAAEFASSSEPNVAATAEIIHLLSLEGSGSLVGYTRFETPTKGPEWLYRQKHISGELTLCLYQEPGKEFGEETATCAGQGELWQSILGVNSGYSYVDDHGTEHRNGVYEEYLSSAACGVKGELLLTESVAGVQAPSVAERAPPFEWTIESALRRGWMGRGCEDPIEGDGQGEAWERLRDPDTFAKALAREEKIHTGNKRTAFLTRFDPSSLKAGEIGFLFFSGRSVTFTTRITGICEGDDDAEIEFVYHLWQNDEAGPDIQDARVLDSFSEVRETQRLEDLLSAGRARRSQLDTIYVEWEIPLEKAGMNKRIVSATAHSTQECDDVPPPPPEDPIIVNIHPVDRTAGHDPEDPLSFEVESAVGVEKTAITALVNETDRSAALEITGHLFLWQVSYDGLEANTDYTIWITATNRAETTATRAVRFDTRPPALSISHGGSAVSLSWKVDGYFLEVSDDLEEWTPVAETKAVGDATIFEDNAVSVRRFYRLRKE